MWFGKNVVAFVSFHVCVHRSYLTWMWFHGTTMSLGSELHLRGEWLSELSKLQRLQKLDKRLDTLGAKQADAVGVTWVSAAIWLHLQRFNVHLYNFSSIFKPARILLLSSMYLIPTFRMISAALYGCNYGYKRSIPGDRRALQNGIHLYWFLGLLICLPQL